MAEKGSFNISEKWDRVTREETLGNNFILAEKMDSLILTLPVSVGGSRECQSFRKQTRCFISV